ncbi:MAG: hypothetical protein EOP51_14005 [Sphingobacteriales bacterium]|nr:MAG: hypothetical protein EOP51_14005 [Sphingobacteriales bacterium]
MNRLLIVICLLACSVSARAQIKLRNVSGVVKSADELTPLEGVTVLIKGTKKISGTQPDGAFYIDVENRDTVFVFSLQGFESKEIRITEANDYPVVLTKAAPSIVFATTYTGVKDRQRFK